MQPEAVGVYRLRPWTAPGRNATMHILNQMDTGAEAVMWSRDGSAAPSTSGAAGGAASAGSEPSSPALTAEAVSEVSGNATFAQKKLKAMATATHNHIVIRTVLDPAHAGHTTLVVACRGSTTADDWATDFTATLMTDRPDTDWDAHVHSGFLARCETIPIEPFLAHLRAGGSVLFTGHSLGSAVAELLCIKVFMHIVKRERRLLARLVLQEHLAFVGFASPLIGTLALGAKLRAPEVGGPIFHHMFHHFQTPLDLVPIMSNLHGVRLSSDFAIVKDALKVLVDTGLGLILPPQLSVLKPFFNSFITGKTWTEFVSFSQKKVPSLSKSYGRWYHMQPDRSFEVFDIRDEAMIDKMVAKDMHALTKNTGDALADGVSHHYIATYETMLPEWCLQKRSPLSVSPFVRAAYIFPLTETSLLKPSTVYYSAGASMLKLAIASEDVAVGCTSAASRVVHLPRCTVSVRSPAATVIDAVRCADAMVCNVVTAEPHEVTLHFPATLDLMPNLHATVTLEGTYVLDDGQPQRLTLHDLPVEAAVDDAQVVDNLRKGLFLALSDTVESDRAAGQQESLTGAFAGLARCQLQELEKVACRRVEFDLQSPNAVVWLRSPDLEQDLALSCLPSAPLTCRLHLVVGSEASESVVVSPSTFASFTAGGGGSASASSFQHVPAQASGYRISRQTPAKALEYMAVAVDGTGTPVATPTGQLKISFLATAAAALVFRLTLTKGSGTGIHSFAWRLTTMTPQGVQCTLNSTTYVATLFWTNELVLCPSTVQMPLMPVGLVGRASGGPIYPVLHGALTECAQLLVHAYLKDQCQGAERTVRRSMIDNPAKYLADLATVRPQEFEAVKRWRACSEDLPSIAAAVLQEKEQPATILSLDKWGLPPALSLCDVFAQWRAACQSLRTRRSEGEVRLPPPPITRFFFAALPLLFDVAMTVCSAVTRNLVVSETNWVQRLFGWKDVTTTLAKEYHVRVLYICSKIRGKDDKFQELRQATLVSPKSEGGHINEALLKRYSLGELERILTAVHVEQPQCIRTVGEFKKLLWDGQAMPATTVDALHFVYQLVLRVAILGKHVCQRIHVAAVFGPQKTGKTTLLECLLGDESLNRFNDANGNTKEPIVVRCATPGLQVVRGCPDCGQSHMDFSSLLPCHLIYDLPGYTDQSDLGAMIPSLQMLVLGCARVLFIVQPIDMQQHNAQRYELLCNVPPTARAVVLLARCNVLFTDIRNMWAQDGVPTPMFLVPTQLLLPPPLAARSVAASSSPEDSPTGSHPQTAEGEDDCPVPSAAAAAAPAEAPPPAAPAAEPTPAAASLVFEWQGLWYAVASEHLDALSGAKLFVLPPPAPASGNGVLLQRLNATPVAVATALDDFDVSAISSLAEVGKVYLAIPAGTTSSSDEDLTTRLREALAEPADMTLADAVGVIGSVLAAASITVPSPQELQALVRKLHAHNITSRWILLDRVVAARQAAAAAPSSSSAATASDPRTHALNYAIAWKIWAVVLQRAKQAQREILPKLKAIMEIDASSFQLYIPRTTTGASFLQDMDSAPHPLFGQSLMLHVQVRENSEIVQGALQRVETRARRDMRATPHHRTLIPVQVQSVPAPGDSVSKLFARIHLNAVLDEEDVKAFVATYEGGLGRCNKELLECLGLKASKVS